MLRKSAKHGEVGHHHHGDVHHHHHVEVPPVPDYTIYRVEDSPQMSKTAKRLEAHGLKDPWARNHVWRCLLLKDKPWIQKTVLLDLFTYGWKIWVPLVIATIAVEKYFGIEYHVHVGHHEGHGDDHHGEAHH